jgi:hypothetical protein
VKVSFACLHGSIDCTVNQKVDHDALSFLPQQHEELGPRRGLQGLHMMIWVNRNQTRNGRRGADGVRSAVWAGLPSKAIAEEVFRPGSGAFPREEQPDDKVNNLLVH